MESSPSSLSRLKTILNYPYTYIGVELLLFMVYLRSSFLHVVYDSLFRDGLLAIITMVCFVFLLRLCFYSLGGSSSSTRKDVFLSIPLPFFLTWKLYDFQRKKLSEENIWIKLSLSMVIFVVAFFTLLLSFFFLLLFFTSPFLAFSLLIQFSIIGPLYYGTIAISESISSSSLLVELVTGWRKQLLILVFSMISVILLLTAEV